MKQLIITDKEANQRLDKYLLKYFGNAPKSFVYKMLRKKRIKYNGVKGSGGEILQKGDKIQMYIAEDTVLLLRRDGEFKEAVEISFTKLYEDKNILVVNKPAGCLSQKDSCQTNDSLIDQILFYLWEKGEYTPQDGFTPALCNRLDRNTSGIVVAGKSVTALQEISKMLQNGTAEKHYLAMVKGAAKSKDTLNGFLLKDEKTNIVSVSLDSVPNSRRITTKYKLLSASDKYSFIEVDLKTGRPHQIRAHLAYAGLPVIGDKKYGHKGSNMTFIRKYGLNHQFLHSYRLVFNNIEGDFSYLNGTQITAPLPKELKIIIDDVFGGL